MWTACRVREPESHVLVRGLLGASSRFRKLTLVPDRSETKLNSTKLIVGRSAFTKTH